MKKNFKLSSVILFMVSLFLLTFTSCTERVEPGYKGLVQTVDGIEQKVLEPGNHSCWGRDKMLLVENAESNYIAQMDVLCKDELNFKFNVSVLARLKNVQSAEFDSLLVNLVERQGGKIEWDGVRGVLKFDVLYNIYVAPKVDAISRSVVSKFETTQIRENRQIIEKEIFEKISLAAKATPIEIVTVVTNNYDYPDIVTKAQEKRKEREIALQEEEAKQALELKRIENREVIAEKEIIVRGKEARAEAIYIQILGSALTERYIKLKAIENQKALYNQAGNKTIIVPEGSKPMVGGN